MNSTGHLFAALTSEPTKIKHEIAEKMFCISEKSSDPKNNTSKLKIKKKYVNRKLSGKTGSEKNNRR